MRDLILITPQSYDLASMHKALPESVRSIFDRGDGRLVVMLGDDDNHQVEISRMPSLADHYDEPEELKALERAGLSPNFYAMHFKDLEKAKLLVKLIANRLDVLVDNDFGLIEEGEKFVRRCEETPGWDWFVSPPFDKGDGG